MDPPQKLAYEEAVMSALRTTRTGSRENLERALECLAKDVFGGLGSTGRNHLRSKHALQRIQ